MKQKNKYGLILASLLCGGAFLNTALTAAAPGGGVWLTNGTVILWKNTIEEYKDTNSDGIKTWTNIHTDFLRFKAERVQSEESKVNVTGAYYTYDGNLQSAPDYQNHPDFVPWHDNKSYVVSSEPSSHYQAFWNTIDASMEDVDETSDIAGPEDIFDSLLLTVVLVWLYGEEFSVEAQAGDVVEWENSSTIEAKGERWLNYTIHIAKNVNLSGSYPNQDNPWGNSTFTAEGQLKYGDETNVLRQHKMGITYDLEVFNNDTKDYDTDQKKFKHELMVDYPSEVLKDTSLGTELGSKIPGYPIGGFLIINMLAVILGVFTVGGQRKKMQMQIQMQKKKKKK